MIHFSERLHDITKRAVVAFSLEVNLDKVTEEASELAAAALQYKQGRIDKMKLALEAADCLVMVARVAALVGWETWDAALKVKLNKAEAYVAEAERAPQEPQMVIVVPRGLHAHVERLCEQFAHGKSTPADRRLVEVSILTRGLRAFDDEVPRDGVTETNSVQRRAE